MCDDFCQHRHAAEQHAAVTAVSAASPEGGLQGGVGEGGSGRVQTAGMATLLRVCCWSDISGWYCPATQLINTERHHLIIITSVAAIAIWNMQHVRTGLLTVLIL